MSELLMINHLLLLVRFVVVVGGVGWVLAAPHAFKNVCERDVFTRDSTPLSLWGDPLGAFGIEFALGC